jgi:leucyl/phenylalanyl-tRNA--protein transferase
MPILLDDDDIFFPDHDEADEYGIVAAGGDLSPERLLSAYFSGIFPWPHPGLPLLWFSPDPRFVLLPLKISINRTLAKLLQNTSLDIKADTNFRAVMKGCQASRRNDQDGTWITDAMIDSYETLHHMGYAHSIEAYRDNRLVGGLYGVSIGSIFFGESMFFVEPNASKIAFITLVGHLIEWEFTLIDCQSHTNHLEKFGASPMKRRDFLLKLDLSHHFPTKLGPWFFHMKPKNSFDFIKTRLA